MEKPDLERVRYENELEQIRYELNKLSGDAVKYTIEEIHDLNTHIHEYLRLTPQTMTIVATVTGAVAASPAITSDVLRHGIFLAAPVVLALVIVYHFNVATEVAARAEQRDRLSARVNRALKTKVFVTRDMSNLLRASTGTIMSSILVGCILLSIVIIGLIYALNTEWFWFQVFASILSLVTTVVAMLGVSSTRREANAVLDKIFGTKDRPDNAALPSDSVWEGFREKTKKKYL